MTAESNAPLKKKKYNDVPSAEELRRTVLHLVTDQNYEEAIDVLQKFLKEKSEFPNFKIKTERFVSHCIDLVYAIKAKKNFPGYSLLTRSKQQEIMDKITDHYNELQDTLSKIDKVIIQLKRDDIKSTMWVFRAVVYSVWFLLIVSLVIEVTGGLYRVGLVVVEDSAGKFIEWIFSLIP